MLIRVFYVGYTLILVCLSLSPSITTIYSLDNDHFTSYNEHHAKCLRVNGKFGALGPRGLYKFERMLTVMRVSRSPLDNDHLL